MSSRYPMQSVCENPFQGGWKQQAAFYPTSRQPWIATAAALTMGRFVQSWRDSNVSLGIKRPMVSASAAAAANNLEKTSGSNRKAPLQRYSPERRQLQPLRHWPWAVSAFWCPAPRHYAQSWRESHASFGRKDVASPLPLHGVLETRQRLLTATYNIGVQCQKYNVRLKSYLKKGNVRIMKCLHNFIFTTLSSLKKIQDKTALHLQCCQVCWHMLASRLEGNKHVLHMDRSTACLLATLSHGSLRNATLSKVFKHSQEDRRKNASIVLAMMY